MTIKIVLPKRDGMKIANGTRFYTDDGHEIGGVTNCDIHIGLNEVISATLTVHVSEIENLEGIEGIVMAEPEPEPVQDVSKTITITSINYKSEHIKEALREMFALDTVFLQDPEK